MEFFIALHCTHVTAETLCLNLFAFNLELFFHP